MWVGEAISRLRDLANWQLQKHKNLIEMVYIDCWLTAWKTGELKVNRDIMSLIFYNDLKRNNVCTKWHWKWDKKFVLEMNILVKLLEDTKLWR
jgi:hypothetical protein